MRLVPPLRRFSRLLIGDAGRADELVEATLRRVLALDVASACAPGLRLMLFKSVVDRAMLGATAEEPDRPGPPGAGDRSRPQAAELPASGVEPAQACLWIARHDLAPRMAAVGRQGIEGGRAVARL